MTLKEYIQALLVMIALALPPDHWLIAYIEDAASHWFWAFLLGASVYFLTWIMFFVPYWGLQTLTRKRVSLAAACIMIGSSLLLALAVGLLSHWWLDYIHTLWYTPLGPELNLR